MMKCHHETITQSDIENGIVNILMDFATLKPAEFIIIKIQLSVMLNDYLVCYDNHICEIIEQCVMLDIYPIL